MTFIHTIPVDQPGEEIFDVTVTAAARCFFSKTLDALGCRADRVYEHIESGLKDALTVGRPIDQGED